MLCADWLIYISCCFFSCADNIGLTDSYIIIILIMTQSVVGFSRLLEWNIRKSQDAKNLAIFQVFRRYNVNSV